MPKITLNNVTVSDAYMALLADRGGLLVCQCGH